MTLVAAVQKEKSRALYMLSEAMREDEDQNIEEALKLYEGSIELLLAIVRDGRPCLSDPCLIVAVECRH